MEMSDQYDDAEFDTDDLLHLRQTLVEFVRKHHITCPETIYQMDSVSLDSLELIEALIEGAAVGYLEVNDDD